MADTEDNASNNESDRRQEKMAESLPMNDVMVTQEDDHMDNAFVHQTEEVIGVEFSSPEEVQEVNTHEEVVEEQPKQEVSEEQEVHNELIDDITDGHTDND